MKKSLRKEEYTEFVIIGRRFFKTAAILDVCSLLQQDVKSDYFSVRCEGCENAKTIKREFKLGDLVVFKNALLDALDKGEEVLKTLLSSTSVSAVNEGGNPHVFLINYEDILLRKERQWEMKEITQARKQRDCYYGIETKRNKVNDRNNQKQNRPFTGEKKQSWMECLRQTCAPDAVAFVDWLLTESGFDLKKEGSSVLDVAGGKGDVSLLLSAGYGIKSTIVDPRISNLSRRQRKLLRRKENEDSEEKTVIKFHTINSFFTAESVENSDELNKLVNQCTCIVGLHPDEATDHIVDVSVARAIPFAIVPCCVFARLFPYRTLPVKAESCQSSQLSDITDCSSSASSSRMEDKTTLEISHLVSSERKFAEKTNSRQVTTREELIEYLSRKHPTIKRASLSCSGANIVLHSNF